VFNELPRTQEPTREALPQEAESARIHIVPAATARAGELTHHGFGDRRAPILSEPRRRQEGFETAVGGDAGKQMAGSMPLRLLGRIAAIMAPASRKHSLPGMVG
jgi:hypothetical protein